MVMKILNLKFCVLFFDGHDEPLCSSDLRIHCIHDA